MHRKLAWLLRGIATVPATMMTVTTARRRLVWPLAIACAAVTALSLGPAAGPDAVAQENAEEMSVDRDIAGGMSDVEQRLDLDSEREQLRTLSLDEALRVGLADNLTLRRVDREPALARASRTIAQAQFDWILSASTRYTRNKNQAAGADSHTLSWNNSVTLSRFFDTGTSASITYFYNKSEAEQAGVTGVTDATGFTLSLEQDLLRNLGFAPNLYRIRLADIGREQADATVLETQRQIRFAIEQAYWNLVFAYADLEVTWRSLQLAIDDVEITERKLQTGVANRLEVLQARVFEAQRRQELFERRQTVRDQSDDLLAQVFPQQLIELMDQHPVLFPQGHQFGFPEELLDQNVRETVELALANRQAIVQAELGREIRELDVTFFKRQLLPDLQAVAGLTLGGGGPNTGQAFEGLGNTNQTNWFLGLEFSYPIENSNARGNLASARAQQEQAEIDVQQATVDVVQEVLGAVRAIRTLRLTLETARVAEELAEQQLEAANRRLDVGSGTRFQRDSFRTDLDIARRNRRRVEVNLQIAVANLRLVTGTIDQPTEEEGIE